MSKLKEVHMTLIDTLAELQLLFDDAQKNEKSPGCPSFSTKCRERLLSYAQTGEKPCPILCQTCLKFMGEIDKIKGEWKET